MDMGVDKIEVGLVRSLKKRESGGKTKRRGRGKLGASEITNTFLLIGLISVLLNADYVWITHID